MAALVSLELVTYLESNRASNHGKPRLYYLAGEPQ
jgi:hypothetical protein